jgi:hypothetical protein
MMMNMPAASLDETITNLEQLKATVEAMVQRNMCYRLISMSLTQMTTPQKSTNRATNVLDILAEARYSFNKRR